MNQIQISEASFINENKINSLAIEIPVMPDLVRVLAHTVNTAFNFIRGTNSSAVTRTLLDRRLVRLAGRKKVVGKPFLYRTTKEFLLHFGLDKASDLPDPEDLVEPDVAEDG